MSGKACPPKKHLKRRGRGRGVKCVPNKRRKR